MFNSNHEKELNKRRTFAIISHPDAGKTTVTEKMLLLGQVIRTSGVVKNTRNNTKHTKSDWMSIEKERGISVTTSIMQFLYKGVLINLLDTPGHQDFSEDTYRILTAVDCCIVILDAAKGVEERTKKLVAVTRLHKTPIITFVNKLDRDSISSIEILDSIEKELKISCIPITWPIGCGRNFSGVYHIYDKLFYFNKNNLFKNTCTLKCEQLSNTVLNQYIDKHFAEEICQELDLIVNVYTEFNKNMFLKGLLTPVFFGSALINFGIDHLLNSLVRWAPKPLYRFSNIRKIKPEEKKFTGFVFKIQANMDLKHRDRIAFIRIVSGQYTKGMKLRHVRIKKNITVSDVFSFLAGKRFSINKAYPGDVIGLHNHGTIKIGDTFTEGEHLQFLGIPNFAPEIFRLIYLQDPLKHKQLIKGVLQLSEEGAVQVFRPIANNNLILGAVGILQFDVIIDRLKLEYKINAIYKKINITSARWIKCNNINILDHFIKNYNAHLAYDTNNKLIYLAPSIAHLNVIQSQNSDIIFENMSERELESY